MAKQDTKVKQPPAPAEEPEGQEITTVEELAAQYPELIEQIQTQAKEDAAAFIAKMKVTEFKDVFVELYGEIVRTVTQASNVPSNLKVAGLLLEIDDPFAEGALRVYAKEKKTPGLRLPFVLPYKDRSSAAAIESYIVRAAGSGDVKRVATAKKALEKAKK